MKKVNLGKRLSLNKETIAKLNDRQMQYINGGQVVESTVACTVSNASCLGGCNTSTKEVKEEVAAFDTCCEDSCHKS